MNIVAVTLVRDSEKFIIPHLKMYTGVTRNIVLMIPQVLKGGASGHSQTRDNSVALIKKHCPEVEIFETETNEWGNVLFNEAIALAGECDKVVAFHADVVMNQENWLKFKEILEVTDADVFKLNMQKCTINYYVDFDHGVRDCLDIEPVAVRGGFRYDGTIYSVDGKSVFTIENEITVHHFCGWKGIFIDPRWKAGIIPSESLVYIDQLKPEGGWLKCPDDIVSAFV